MATCYVFAIGGSGARILESFTHLVAAGCAADVLRTPETPWNIEPIIVDLDTQNGNTKRCIDTLQNYESIQSKIQYPGVAGNAKTSDFFRVPFTRNIGTGADFLLQLQADGTSTLDGTLNYTELTNPEDTRLVDLLYSDAVRMMSLNHGFKGVPSIGTLVLNQFENNPLFNNFVQRYTQGDRIVIIGSVFGGTGAAGLPILLKNIRKQQGQIKDAPIAIIPVMPYYQIAADPTGESMIDSSTFIARTKAALLHYRDNLAEAHINYYIGHNSKDSFTNCDGGPKQKNSPMAIEMIAATAIFDFLNRPAGDFPSINAPNFPTAQQELVFGFDADGNEEFNLAHLKGTQMGRWLNEALMTYYYACLMSHYTYDNITVKNSRSVASIKFSQGFGQSAFVRDYHNYFHRFMTWLDEMSKNMGEPAFRPFATFPISQVPQMEKDKKLPYLINELPIVKGRGLIFKSLPYSISEAFSHFTGVDLRGFGNNDMVLYNEIFYHCPRTFMSEYAISG